MTNQLPYEGPLEDDDDVTPDDSLRDGVLEDGLGDDEDRPLDPDLDDDRVDSAAADERAATEGTLDVEDLP
ncbi:MAG: hypothetical protein ACTHNQ_08550 [Microbacterium sp.]|jgi:hypothetical protein|uniref:hypothetical protein n=1 Tax=Microbacterium sp. TaxID=51671 RepID=UPI003F812576